MGIFHPVPSRRPSAFSGCVYPGKSHDSRKVLLIFLLLIYLVITGCSGSGGGSAHSQNPGAEQSPLSLNRAALFSTVSSITVHIAYEPDAQPFSGAFQNGLPYWSILESNIDALFLGRPVQPDVNVPMDLSDMVEITDQGNTSWTIEQIMGLAQQQFDIPQTASTADFFLFFLNGKFNNEGVISNNVVGVSINETPVIVLFKDVILESGMTLTTDIFIEQATLVHEFGHSVGLVNLGIPMAVPHEDPDHQHHCANQECVMFWENDSTNLVFFIQKIMDSSSVVLFGAECLEDARSFKP